MCLVLSSLLASFLASPRIYPSFPSQKSLGNSGKVAPRPLSGLKGLLARSFENRWSLVAGGTRSGAREGAGQRDRGRRDQACTCPGAWRLILPEMSALGGSDSGNRRTPTAGQTPLSKLSLPHTLWNLPPRCHHFSL